MIKNIPIKLHVAVSHSPVSRHSKVYTVALYPVEHETFAIAPYVVFPTCVRVICPLAMSGTASQT
jgi:hypothetical protein